MVNKNGIEGIFETRVDISNIEFLFCVRILFSLFFFFFGGNEIKKKRCVFLVALIVVIED